MNVKRALIAILAVFAFVQLNDFIVHNLILGSTYRSLSSVWRPDMMDYMWVMFITSFVQSVFFVYIFIKGYEKKGVLEGIKYGLIIGLFLYTPASFNGFAIYPIPISLAVKWFVFGLIGTLIGGTIVSLIYKSPEES